MRRARRRDGCVRWDALFIRRAYRQEGRTVVGRPIGRKAELLSAGEPNGKKAIGKPDCLHERDSECGFVFSDLAVRPSCR
jgi:hypothetical protein